jgi:hypothetical protein
MCIVEMLIIETVVLSCPLSGIRGMGFYQSVKILKVNSHVSLLNLLVKYMTLSSSADGVSLGHLRKPTNT